MKLATRVKLSLAGVVVGGFVMTSVDITPYVTGRTAQPMDREKPHKVELWIKWTPDRNVYAAWHIGHRSDEEFLRREPPVDCTTSPTCVWYRAQHADEGDTVGLTGRADVVADGPRKFICEVWQDGDRKRYSDDQSSCTLRWVVTA